MKRKTKITFNSTLQEEKIYNNCGVFSKHYSINKKHGKGTLVNHSFDGLYIEYFHGTFNNNYIFDYSPLVNGLEVSVLIKGSKIINCKHVIEDIVHEEQETILSISKNLNGHIKYYKDITVKEVKIKLFYEFIKKHQLNALFSKVHGHSNKNNFCDIFIVPICDRTQNILTELLADKRTGILKRLFLEAKVLELVSIQVEQQKKENTNIESLVKKLYTVKSIISSNLNEQYSIKSLSKKVLLNDTILKKEFKRVFNTTISEFSFSVRMNKAKDLLLHTNKPIYEISDIVGYKNPTHFSAAFKKNSRLTPKQFRNTYCEV